MNDEILKNGFIGSFNGYRIHGKSYGVDGNEVEERHEPDCVCCHKDLFKGKLKERK
jgi:hypothetical protein